MKFATGRAPVALSQITWNRYRRSANLASNTVDLMLGKIGRNSIDLGHKLHCFLPYNQVAITSPAHSRLPTPDFRLHTCANSSAGATIASTTRSFIS